MRFEVVLKDKSTKARMGRIYTGHGNIETPCFMPVGTHGSVKTLSPEDLNESRVQIILVNTYYLYLKPGEEITINYIATEPNISHHFHCDCMSKNCKGSI